MGHGQGSRDIIFKIYDPRHNFLTGEARHFVFIYLLDATVSTIQWMINDTQMVVWSGLLDQLFKF